MDFDYSQVFIIKFATFFAGLLGATVTLIKKSRGSVISRLGGYVCAIIAIIYVMPALIESIKYVLNYQLPNVLEHILAFIFGMLANTFIENFLDDPAGSLSRWISNIKKFKKMIFNQTPIDSISIVENNKILSDNDSTVNPNDLAKDSKGIG